jgi:hypothetical protein
MNICRHFFSDSTRKGRCLGYRKGNECTAYHYGNAEHVVIRKGQATFSTWNMRKSYSSESDLTTEQGNVHMI